MPKNWLYLIHVLHLQKIKQVKSLDAKKLINKIEQGILKNGINAEEIAADLRELRPYALEEEDPLVVKVIRMAYEHLDANGTFEIQEPEEAVEEGEEDEEEEVVEQEPLEVTDETRIASLQFFLALLANSEAKINRPDITAYKFAFMAFAEA